MVTGTVSVISDWKNSRKRDWYGKRYSIFLPCIQWDRKTKTEKKHRSFFHLFIGTVSVISDKKTRKIRLLRSQQKNDTVKSGLWWIKNRFFERLSVLNTALQSKRWSSKLHRIAKITAKSWSDSYFMQKNSLWEKTPSVFKTFFSGTVNVITDSRRSRVRFPLYLELSDWQNAFI